jgi:hypothetical membrane protein
LGAETSQENIVAIRLYLSALTLVFLFLVWTNRGVGPLEAIVIVAALIYLILDAREYLQLARADLELTRQLEKKISDLFY